MAALRTRKRNGNVNGLDCAVKTEEDFSGKVKRKGEESVYFKKDCKDISNVIPYKRARLKIDKNHISNQLGRLFYARPCEELAKNLLGKLLYRILDDGEVLCGRIVETEAYLGEVDKACHAYGGKKTERCEPMYMAPGTAYVYIIYGIYHCLNISSQEAGACVLIRALEPLQGLSYMKSFRGVRRKDGGNKLKDFQLGNGPSKLCQAFCIEKANLNKEDMATSERFWLEDDRNFHGSQLTIVTSTRIGLNSCGPEWALKPLRFYILGNKCVSVRDKKAESEVP
ncbi:probable DNA-3-methyladenine glycosylase [Stylophora pistillata]|uniref:probable DNA-3-methyladenine glycosylase n=1 Tax=Stylophora pistillata TaxID=50429 RepID=UPI000C04A7C1|nr:probable DNA-3-methyladenine glycosylase [Stylophora pistillata]